MYPVNTLLLTTNRSRKNLSPIGMVVHSTATPGATDQAEVKYFNSHPERQASAHVFIDWDSITKTIPFNEQAWHAGGHANKQFIGIELCEPAGHDPVKFEEVWKRAVWYFGYIFVTVLKIKLVTKFNLMSHAEVSDKWGETDHTDPVSFFKSYGKTVDQFRAEVQAEVNRQLKGGK